MSKFKDVQWAEVKNYYEDLPKKYRDDERTYEDFNKVHIKIPFRMLVTGESGSGKTNAVRSLIETLKAWDKYIVIAKDLTESLYAEFIDAIREVEKKEGESLLTVGTSLDELPSVDAHDKKLNTLLIIDDQITDGPKKLAKATEYAIRGRKKHVSMIFLTQDYFSAPITLRKQCGYFIFNKISTVRDLHIILKDFQLGVTDEQLEKLYEEATSGGFPNYLMIDKVGDPELRFRKGYKPLDLPTDVSIPDKVKWIGKGEERKNKAESSRLNTESKRTIKHLATQEKQHNKYTEKRLATEDRDESLEKTIDDIQREINSIYEEIDDIAAEDPEEAETLQAKADDLEKRVIFLQKRKSGGALHKAKRQRVRETIPQRLKYASQQVGKPMSELRRVAKIQGMSLPQYLTVIEQMLSS